VVRHRTPICEIACEILLIAPGYCFDIDGVARVMRAQKCGGDRRFTLCSD
jgi:hypothetical protein